METESNHSFGLRAARASDIGWVHRVIMQTIDESPHYNEIFKHSEKKRMSRGYLGYLYTIDPWHLAIHEVDGQRAGVQVSSPECGTLFLHWSIALPEYRHTGIGFSGLSRYLNQFNHSKWHKAATITRTTNRPALLVLKRNGFREVMRLEAHIFGEDYIWLEAPLVKSVEGYDMHFRRGIAGRVRERLRLFADLVLPPRSATNG